MKGLSWLEKKEGDVNDAYDYVSNYIVCESLSKLSLSNQTASK